MEYSVLTIGIPDELFSNLKKLIVQYRLRFIMSPTVHAAGQMLSHQPFHLLMVNLEYLRSIQQTDWLIGIRRISFVPVIIISDTPEKDMKGMIELGADMCVSGKWPYSMIADLAYAQLRRYTEYNHYRDPARRIVMVQGRSVDLRPREFSLLLYFMQNPKIVLTAEQICEHAWEMEGSYNRGVSGPIALLRKGIEPDISNPCYIETIPRIGYRFTAYRDETCDDCSSSVGLL